MPIDFPPSSEEIAAKENKTLALYRAGTTQDQQDGAARASRLRYFNTYLEQARLSLIWVKGDGNFACSCKDQVPPLTPVVYGSDPKPSSAAPLSDLEATVKDLMSSIPQVWDQLLALRAEKGGRRPAGVTMDEVKAALQLLRQPPHRKKSVTKAEILEYAIPLLEPFCLAADQEEAGDLDEPLGGYMALLLGE